MLWKPLSPFFSGYFLGFLTASAFAYVIIQMYLRAKGDDSIAHEWIDFPELEKALQDGAIKEDKQTSLHVGYSFEIVSKTIICFTFLDML